MGKVTGFQESKRELPARRSIAERTRDWREIYVPWAAPIAQRQAGRCMDCGIPFCTNGCPLGNLIPEWNDLVYNGDWRGAIDRLHATNNFPEFTGRICPAPCEPACTLAINDGAVTIEMIEKKIADVGWEQGWIKPEPPTTRTGFKVGVVGSGPAGLATAQQLNRVGHTVVVFERDEYPGGLLRLGIPDFKLEKEMVDRRIGQLEQEGVQFEPSTEVGVDVSAEELLARFDAVCLAGGSTVPRDLPIKGRELKGVHFAMDYLTQQNRIAWEQNSYNGAQEHISADAKQVVIIGGGDTGADCLGTARRQGASNITQIEIMDRPPDIRHGANPWPQWPLIYRVSPAHEEGCEREYSVLTKHFVSDGHGNVSGLRCVHVEWQNGSNGRPNLVETPNSEFTIEAQLVLLAMGFIHPQHTGLLNNLGVNYDSRGNVKTDVLLKSNIDKVFACGDMQTGQSLVVTAIASGRSCARSIDMTLSGGSSRLPAVRGYFRPQSDRALSRD